MNAPQPEDADRERDPLTAYADGDPEAVQSARPREPSDEQWDAARRRIHARLAPPGEPNRPPRLRRIALGLAAAALTASAAGVAWIAFQPAAPKGPQGPEVAERNPGGETPAEVEPPTYRGGPDHPDPLAEFAVLPVASADDVVLYRVPGDGCLPVGHLPLPDALSLATTEDVELDDPNPAWPSVTPSPGDAPMIFAAKPR